MSGPPPPPPPHGEGVPKSSGLPPGKYDIFVIPEHSAGSGFLYLPSLQPNINSFVAGFACALILVVLGQSMAPAFRSWWDSFQGLGNMGMLMLMVGIGFGAWSLGRTQQDGPPGGRGPGPSSGHARGHGASTGFGASQGAAPNPDGPPPPPPPHGSAPPPNTGPPPTPGREKQRPTWDDPPFEQQAPPRPEPPRPEPPPSRPEPPRPEPPPSRPEPPPSQPEPTPQPKPKPAPEPTKPEAPPPKSAWQKAREETKASWEKAREETRRKQEEQKAKEAEQKRREETSRRLAELRAKEAKERQAREAERLRKEKEAKDARDKEAAELRAKDLAEKLERERKERERLEKLAKELEEKRKKEKEEEDARSEARKGSSYAFSGVGEKTSMWPNGRPPVPKQTATPSVASKTPSTASKTPSNADKKPPPQPSAKTYVSVDEETYSYRPYDQPKMRRKKSMSSMTGSESSWAPSHTTAQTSPNPSMRGPYTTKDPDKIVISAVYLFMNQFAKTPASQLLSGIGSVTDGLILRITTEGLFIDDDVRGVPQREWDVKAWTLKLVEVWCPPHCLNSSSFSASPFASNNSSNLLHKLATSRVRAADRGAPRTFTGDEAEVFLNEMSQACMGCCRFGLCEQTFKNTNIPSQNGQTGEWKTKGLHILRATIRDQESKRYLFVIDETESWKIAAGLQRLKRGPQSRQIRPLSVSAMSATDARSTLEMLGWNR